MSATAIDRQRAEIEEKLMEIQVLARDVCLLLNAPGELSRPKRRPVVREPFQLTDGERTA